MAAKAVVAREVMVPRNDIVAIDAKATLDDVLRVMIEAQHSRLPCTTKRLRRLSASCTTRICCPSGKSGATPYVAAGPATARIAYRAAAAPTPGGPQTKPLSQLLAEFRHGHSHMAMVVDEFGTIAGMLTVEDVLSSSWGASKTSTTKRCSRARRNRTSIWTA